MSQQVNVASWVRLPNDLLAPKGEDTEFLSFPLVLPLGPRLVRLRIGGGFVSVDNDMPVFRAWLKTLDAARPFVSGQTTEFVVEIAGGQRQVTVAINPVTEDLTLCGADGASPAYQWQLTLEDLIQGAMDGFLPLSGGTLTGPLTLAADPMANLEAATKQYADSGRANDNLIINGNFAVNQRGYAVTGLPPGGYGHDRWRAGPGAFCTYTFTQELPDTTIRIVIGTLMQIVEAGMIEGSVYTLSWEGTVRGRIYQGAPAGAYVVSPITTPPLAAGVNTMIEFSGDAGTLTKVKFESGTIATPFKRDSLAKCVADCQRYFQPVTASARFPASGPAQSIESTINWSLMRANPIVTVREAGVDNNLAAGFPRTETINRAGMRFSIASAGPGDCYSLNYSYNCDAEL